MANCVKCGKEINPARDYYSRPSGIECVKCGERTVAAPDPIKMQAFLLKIAKLERGCAPSAGYMEELILEAREILNIKTKK